MDLEEELWQLMFFTIIAIRHDIKWDDLHPFTPTSILNKTQGKQFIQHVRLYIRQHYGITIPKISFHLYQNLFGLYSHFMSHLEKIEA
ncbi:hypothetical protein [Geobacillus sp. WSUCF-018B]|uniref:hypothetical protein n=1 Tax=Geobacillus sp. WSUCF-018B TaxID=2055939 RepID=UPI000C294C8F|nr:hypothetical protein [Geobacillus sp. WSUCF-018B]PJW18905.1 hypothetical protein CV944_01495 [Geobacillus sp. WSUCF-018B]